MKEKYIKPDSDIQKFATVDVITTSGGGDDLPQIVEDTAGRIFHNLERLKSKGVKILCLDSF